MKTTQVIQYICGQYNVRWSEILGKNKTKRVTMARHVGMYLCIERCGMSQEEVGKMFDRERSTVPHAVKKIKAFIQDGRIDLSTLDKLDLNEALNLRETFAIGLDRTEHNFKTLFRVDPMMATIMVIDHVKQFDEALEARVQGLDKKVIAARLGN